MTEPTRAKIPQLPWPKITGMRHRIAHEYADIDQEVVWRVATVYVPELLRNISEFLSACGIDLSGAPGPATPSADPNDPTS